MCAYQSVSPLDNKIYLDKVIFLIIKVNSCKQKKTSEGHEKLIVQKRHNQAKYWKRWFYSQPLPVPFLMFGCVMLNLWQFSSLAYQTQKKSYTPTCAFRIQWLWKARQNYGQLICCVKIYFSKSVSLISCHLTKYLVII